MTSGEDPPVVRVFVSSPSDVAEERSLALGVLRRVQAWFRGRCQLLAVFWETEPLGATAGFQEEIVRRAPPSSADIALFVLWSRLGTTLPETFAAPDGQRPTGTEWEFQDAVRANRERGAPHVLVYRKTAPVTVSLGMEARAQTEARQQFDAVQGFFQRYFRDADDVSFTGSYHAFRQASEFGLLLETHLTKLLSERLGAASATWHESPFRGLEAFDVRHAPVFFGRSRALHEVRQALRLQVAAGRAFVLILGMSGNGKSSLLRAGLLPLLEVPGAVEDGVVGGTCRQAVVRPGEATTPLLSLAQALLAPGALPELAAHGSATQLAAALGAGGEPALALLRGALARAAPAPQRLVLGVDQLEEALAGERAAEPQRAAFLDLLDAFARSGLVYVLATVRSDFYPQVCASARLRALKEGAGQYDLPAPDAAEIAQIIRRPAQVAGLTYETDVAGGRSLDEVLLAEASQGPDALPLLQYALSELYERRRQPGNVLTFAAYRELGGVEGALARRAQEEWTALDPEAQAALPAVMRTLVDMGPDGTHAATRRRAPWAEATRTPGARVLVERFVGARLLAADRGADGERVVSIVHEALLRRWEALEQLIAAEAQLLRCHTRVRTAAAAWVARGRRTDDLDTGRRLLEDQDLLARGFDLSPQENEFVAASLARARRARVLRRAVAGTIAVLALVAGLLAVLASHRAREAESERNLKARALDDVLRLSDAQRVADLLAGVDELWPLRPEQAPPMADWLAQARGVLANRARHAERLAALRAQAPPQGPEQRRRERESWQRRLDALDLRLRLLEVEGAATAGELGDDGTRRRATQREESARLRSERERLAAEEGVRRDYRFDDDRLDWQHQALVDLLAGLDRLDSPASGGGSVAEVVRRLEFVSTLRQRSLDVHAAAWRSAAAHAATSPRYQGLVLAPQLGLVPLGVDPESGLLEFGHLGLGSLPTRDPVDGRLRCAADATVVLVLLPGGTFTMGAQRTAPDAPNHDPLAEESDGPVHPVTLSPFFLAKHECTQAQWAALAGGARPSAYTPRVRADVSERNPVEQVSWDDCVLWLPRHGLVLPSEAQWEYACRAGTTSAWFAGNRAADLQGAANIADRWAREHGGPAAWVYTEEVEDGYLVHAPVGSFRPNAFGLHDTHGNVYEWCQDAYLPYAPGPATDPRIEGMGYRVRRGGGWLRPAGHARAGYRYWAAPSSSHHNLGVRPARALDRD